ncbi:MAG: tripartite tricarboxylate transporter permease [Armatimonadetes bacterium]|nr:tripartite tricarboxylate transporter permease [Armatimonadota bacterium]
METLQHLLGGFQIALLPVNLLFAFAGVVIGQLIGVLPGIGPPAGVAILLPATFKLNPTSAMIMFAGIYYGAMYGGTITSVLINIPGEAASVMTTLDGHQMARQGRAGPALGIAAFGSFIAGTIATVILMFFAPWLAGVALSFGPPEYAALMVLAFALVIGLTAASPARGLASLAAGLFLAVVGVDVMTGLPRFTFGQLPLLDGMDFVPVAMGIFGIGEVLVSLEDESAGDAGAARLRLADLFPNRQDWALSRVPILRGSLLGFLIGALPGAGATTASMVSYAAERRFSRHPERFGHGAIEGVAGPESANNAAAVGALVPLLTLGIPGSATTAVMLGGLLIFGLRPGPLLYQQHPDYEGGLIASMYIGNAMLVVLNTVFIPVFVAAVRVQKAVLAALIVTFSIVGVYSLENSMFSVWLMLLFGGIGFFMKKLQYPPAPLVLALVLGQTLEMAVRQSLKMSHGDLGIFISRPLSAALLTVALAMVVLPALPALRRRVAGGRKVPEIPAPQR